MANWLFKSEPEVFGWPDQLALGAKGGEWHGIRNYQARNNMRLMQIRDQGFFYHSSTGKTIVGIVECQRAQPRLFPCRTQRGDDAIGVAQLRRWLRWRYKHIFI